MLIYNKLLVFVFLSGFCILYSSAQNARPRFLELKVDGVDGVMLDILTIKGIKEDVPVDTLLGRLRCRDPDGDDITYRGEGQTLRVEPNGDVYLDRVLDKEKENANADGEEQPLRQVFFCKDSTNLESSYTLQISITDINDNAPVFAYAALSAQVPEDTQINTIIRANISIRDIDRDENAVVTVSCSDTETACEYFGVRSTQRGNGIYLADVYLKKPLDYETARTYTMTLLAKDKGGLNSTANIIIEVIDTQDSDPQFLNVPLTVYVTENARVGSNLLTQISAQDQDVGSPRPLIIEIENDPKNLFRIGKTDKGLVNNYVASLIVADEIDREQLLSIYTLSVRATELDENGQKTNATVVADVTVNINDLNDNQPIFNFNNFAVNLTERDLSTVGGSIQTQVPDLNIQITDPDETSNARYRVVIAQQSFIDTFRVFPDQEVSGSVGVNLLINDASKLDFDNEQFKTHVVILEARESPNNQRAANTSTATVTISLIDLNDNSPRFDSKVYSADISENANVGENVIKITATDKDEGKNGQITYSLRGTDADIAAFAVDPVTGQVTLAQKLDFETQSQYPILFDAEDNGSPKRRTSVTLTINVLDFNDVGPVFERVSYQTYASETTTELQPEVQVKASDPENPNGQIIYTLVAGNIDNAFRIDSLTGQLTLQKLIDYDQTPGRLGIIRLIVQATDTGPNGEAGVSTNATITVNVRDENNHIPVFNNLNYNKTISELQPRNSVLLAVNATDDDEGDNGAIRYFIDRGALDNFEINPTSGLITISPRASFDYDNKKRYDISIYAIDTGNPPKTGTTTVTVHLTDANNKNPSIPLEIYSANVRDDAPLGTEILNINATDPDSDSKIRYELPLSLVQARDRAGSLITRISPFDYRTAFVVDSNTGRITTNAQLSRDLAAEISFVIRAEDMNSQTGIQTATTSVLVTVVGTDLSAITFNPPWSTLRPSYSFSLIEKQQSNISITTLSARDPACGYCVLDNYVITSNPQNFFRINQRTGELTLTKPLDYEDKENRMVEVTVQAISNNSRSAFATVSVQVLDDNDNTPVFNDPFYVFNVGEFDVYPKTVGTLRATDKDSGSYGDIEYSISGQFAEDFRIYSKTGLIIIEQGAVLDYESKREYNLLAIATDNPQFNKTASEIRKQTSVPLKIIVADENDNAPSFGDTKQLDFFTVESFPSGANVGTVKATDKDSGTNSEILYSIRSAPNEGFVNVADLFTINPVSGIISTRQRLRGRSSQSPYPMIIVARDSGQPVLSAEINVIIHVSSGQLDDGKPYWSYPLIGQNITVPENAEIDYPVIKVLARARTPNASVIYDFVKSSNRDYMKFAIDPRTGQITVAGNIDREIQSVYTVIVSARDSINQTESYRLLYIRVLDVDDNIPSFDPDQKYRACEGRQLSVPVEISMTEEQPIDTFVYQVTACDPDAPPRNMAYYYPEMDIDICKEEMEKDNFKVTENGQIYTNKVLNREVQRTYLVCVQVATQRRTNRKRRAVFDTSKMVDRSRVAYIEITLTDVNDNRPVFERDIYKEILLPIPDKDVLTTIQAIDADEKPFNRVLYSITRIQYYDTNENFQLPGAFSIDVNTGVISVALPTYVEFTDNYFILDLFAEDIHDSTLNDTAQLFVYVVDRDRSLKFVLNESPDIGITKANTILSELNGASSTHEFKLREISYHSQPNGNKDVSKTDICFVMVSNQNVLNIQNGRNEILEDSKYRDVLEKYQVKVSDIGNCYPASASMNYIDWSDLWWTLVALAIFIFICCIILIIAACIFYRNYRRYMDTQKTYMVQE